MTAPAFVPEPFETDAPRHGRRRRPDAVLGAAIAWPYEMAERRAAVRAWRKMAARILNEERQSFRLLSVLPDQVIWTSGEVWATNSRLADEAGGCSAKTIQRDVEFLRLRGLVVVIYGWRRNDSGQFARTRTMQLSVPRDQVDHLDHGCPLVLDHGCPITVEDAGGSPSTLAAVDTLAGVRPDPSEAVDPSCHHARDELGSASLASLIRTEPISGPSDLTGSRLRDSSARLADHHSHRTEEGSVALSEEVCGG